MGNLIESAFKTLYLQYGPQYWWPAETAFEVCIGAILTQNTSWKNVEKAIREMKKRKLMSRKCIIDATTAELEEAIRPAGFYRQKAERLKAFCTEIDINSLKTMQIRKARDRLLSIKGIGRETADSILLYALGKPIFVVDAYTRRIYSRLSGNAIDNYDLLREIFESSLGGGAKKYNEMHALLVEHAKLYCLKNNPKCVSCPLLSICNYGSRNLS